jgi:hypothetical protein
MIQADMNFAIKEGAGREHHSASAKSQPNLGHSAHNSVALNHQIIDGLLKKPEIRLVLKPETYRLLVKQPICLGAGRTNCRALGRIQDTKLDTRFVSGYRHCTAQCVYLAHQMSFANTPYRRIAGHLTQRLDVMRQKQGFLTHAGRHKCSLRPGVTTSDDNDIKFSGEIHGNRRVRDKAEAGL